MKCARTKAWVSILLLMVFLGACGLSPEARRDRYMARGKELVQNRDYSRAILEFRNAARMMPNDAEVYYQMGMAYSAASDFGLAVAAYRKALGLNPQHAEAQLRISQILALTDNKENWSDAETRLKALLEGASQTPEMLNTLAFTELKLGNVPSAVQSLERALVQSPGELSSAVLLARTKLWQKDARGAEEVLIKACNNAPKSADAPRLLGEFFINQNRMSEAEAQLRRALEIDSKSGPALMDLARLQLTAGRKQEAEQNFRKLAMIEAYKPMYAIFLFQDGRRDEAIREFERIANENPNDRQARTRLVAAYGGANRIADATKVLDAALKKNPKDSEALLQRGEILIKKGAYRQAEADLNQVLRLQPSAPEVHYVLAKLNEARGAMLIYRQELSAALGLNPNLQSVRVELAQDLVNHGEGRAALDLLNSAPESQKSSTAILVQRNWALWLLADMQEMRKGIDRGLLQERSPDLLIQDGLWKLRSGNYSGARTVLEEALKIDPSDVRALRVFNETYAAQKNAPAALQKVKEYAARQPKSAPVQGFLGVMLMANGNRTQAREAFAAAKAADPTFVEADLSFVQLDVLDGKLDDARRRLNSVLSVHSGNLTARKWLGNLEVMRGDPKAAVEHFRQAVEANPADAQAANNLAYLLAEGKQTEEALRYAQKAVELAPKQPEYCDTLGWVLYKKGLYSAAVKYFELASVDPKNAVWKYHLAMAYAKAGDPRRGRATLEAALKVNAQLPEAKVARDLLDQMK